MVSMDNTYTAPITLGFTPANGDLIGGTVNGVEVNGEWKSGDFVALYEGALDVSTYGDVGGQHICSIGIADGQAQIVVQSKSTPTTDYELHLYRYTPAAIVQIPQEYVEGLEDVAENANEAKTAAETAQTTANAAKTAAETAQSTANAAKTAAETAQSTANAAKTAAETAQSTANAAKTAAETAAPKNNPEFTGTFSLNRKPGSTIGTRSHTEGYLTTASSDSSHAEGLGTVASGVASHAEGNSSIASGDDSHAEGRSNATGNDSHAEGSGNAKGNYSHAEGTATIASGVASHAEGSTAKATNTQAHAEGTATVASGDSSHAEGTATAASGNSSHAEGDRTTASGNYSHAEGRNTTSSGAYSHSEGWFTVAQGLCQHVQGAYNVASGTQDNMTEEDYIHIVGNGESETARSNAHTLTYGGVPWYQGRPQFGGAAMNDGAQTVMGNGDKDISLASSTTDSTKQIKITVSDDARPTFTDTSDPNNTWTPGENLPTVTSSDSGKFLRVSESGAWEAEAISSAEEASF